MAATIASKAQVTLQRAPDGSKAWNAIAGKLTVATAMSLDTLVSLLTERHGGMVALINTAHISQPAAPDRASAVREDNAASKRAARARRARK